MTDACGTPVEQAQAILDLVHRDPAAAITDADDLLARTDGTHLEAQAIAEQAAGLALRELDDLPAGLVRARRAVRIADRSSSPRLAARARLSLALLLANAGITTKALQAIDQALPDLHGADIGRARMQRGLVLHYAGRRAEAEPEYTAAVRIARRYGDRVGEAKALNNRGSARAFLGSGDAAQRDLERAGQLYDDLRLPVAAADVRWNAAFVKAQQGDIPTALAGLADVRREYDALGVPRPSVVLDQIDILLSVPLVEEAIDLAEQAVAELEERGMPADAAEARLALARAVWAAGDAPRAAAEARAARAAFRRQSRRTWEVASLHVELRALVRSGRRPPQLAADLQVIAGELHDMGWRTPALEARIDAADILTECGDNQAFAEWATASRARRGGTAMTRVLGWYASGRLHELGGHDARAAQAWRRGLDELDSYRASLGATDLRASSGAHGRRLAERGIRMAVDGGRPAQVLAWAERWRAGAVLMRPVTTSDDDLDEALTALRVTSQEVTDAALAGESTVALRQRQALLERRVRDIVRHRAGTAMGHPLVRPPTVHALDRALGGACLVEFITFDDGLWAVVVAAGRATMHQLGASSHAERHLERLAFSLRRLTSLVSSDEPRAAARKAADATAADLDNVLLQPLRRRVAGRPLVLVPTGALHTVPWSMLPTCHGRLTTVAPSAALWLRASMNYDPSPAARVIAAGPGLPGARAEAVQLATEQAEPTSPMGSTRLLIDGEATAGHVLEALEGADVAHIAAHGVLRADNPLFSALALADGPLTVYDFERLEHPPSTVVLSACDAGRPVVRPGDEVMGLAAALLGLGTRTLVSTVLPVHDGAAAALMVEFHRRLGRGDAPAAALAGAQLALSSQDDHARATSAAFVCFGAGLR